MKLAYPYTYSCPTCTVELDRDLDAEGEQIEVDNVLYRVIPSGASPGRDVEGRVLPWRPPVGWRRVSVDGERMTIQTVRPLSSLPEGVEEVI